MLVTPHSRRNIDPSALDAQDIAIEDIAHALAHQACHGGRSLRFYSRAERAFRLAMIVPRELRIAAMLHEAEHAYAPDEGTPPIRDSIRAAIRHRFGLAAQDFSDLQPSITAQRKLEAARLFTPCVPGQAPSWGMPPMAAMLRYLRAFDEAIAARDGDVPGDTGLPRPTIAGPSCLRRPPSSWKGQS